MREKFTLVSKFKIHDGIFFVHAHLKQTSFSNFSTDFKFSFSEPYPLRVRLYGNASEASKGYSEFGLGIEQDLHFYGQVS